MAGQCLGQHVLVESEVRHEPLQPSVLLLELPQSPQLTHTQVRVLFLPHVKRRFAHAELPTNISHCRPGLGLATCPQGSSGAGSSWPLRARGGHDPTQHHLTPRQRFTATAVLGPGKRESQDVANACGDWCFERRSPQHSSKRPYGCVASVPRRTPKHLPSVPREVLAVRLSI